MKLHLKNSKHLAHLMTQIYKHLQAAHCENGVTSGLLKHYGVSGINEPLAFGIGSGLFYIHIPFLNFNNGPAISFRTMPGSIFKRTCKSLGIKVFRRKFSHPAEARIFLDEKIADGIPVGCQVGVFHLPYFPPEYRFHFNAHNLVVFGKDETHYLISDPIMETVTRLTPEELEKVRFAKGFLAPRGHIYYPLLVPDITQDTLKRAIIRGIRRNTRDMLHIPGGIAGVKGIAYTGRKIRKWRDQHGVRKAGLYLAQIVRMQEEIGTGGGGFRYLYAAFLEQASVILEKESLRSISDEFTKAGDLWREAAIQMAGIYKGRIGEQKDFKMIADMFIEISETEKRAFKNLLGVMRK